MVQIFLHWQAFDLFRLLRSSRATLPCLDQHLPGQILSPGHTVVLHGEVPAMGVARGV